MHTNKNTCMKMSEEFDNNQCLLYFQEALSLLEEYHWVFNFPVTHLLVLNVLNEIPSRWKNVLNCMSTEDLNTLPLGAIKTNWPECLIKFSQDCFKLKFPPAHCDDASGENGNNSNELSYSGKKVPVLKNRGVAPKKMMEVTKLTDCIHSECEKIGVTHILDMGSGLGYLDQALHTSHGYRVLGLETQTSFVQTATKKQQTSCPSQTSVIFKQFHMEAGQKGINQAAEEVKNWFEKSSGSARCIHEEGNLHYVRPKSKPEAALVGLHTCGDLAASTLELFTSSNLFSVLVLSPCCFHKITCLESTEDAAEKFENFPLSKILSSVIDRMNCMKFLRRPFLRLASQRSAMKWSQQSEDEHKQHSKHVLSRAVLQLYASKKGLDITKRRRRALGKANLHSSGVEMVKHMMSRYQLIHNQTEPTDETSGQYLQDVIKLYNEHKYLCPLIEGLTALQTALQGVAERLVVSDMQALLAEHGTPRNRVVPLWDESRSPRARAILATRDPSST